VSELTVEFRTGGDDLRGGNDNVDIWLLLRTGTHLRFENVNDLRQWPNNSRRLVVRDLPSTITFADILGVRLEVTASGGGGGDNWNLDGLSVRAQLNGETRRLFSRSGTPLFRFTGDQRARDFLFTATPVPPTPPVMTSFTPTAHGFNFINEFKNLFISELNWTTGGLCGGMVYAALDYFHARTPVPSQDYMPAEGTPFQSYLYNRQVDSINSNVDKWAELGFNPFGHRNREFFNWGVQAGSGRLGELRARIDLHHPVPLGLQTMGGEGERGHHQVLALGYELGRYKGDLGDNIEDFSIFVYDPNLPNRVMTLKPDVAHACYFYAEEKSRRWRAYFVDTKYSAKLPPAIPTVQNELMAEFRTGDDDLRGGNDNVHLSVLHRSAAPLRFENVNDLKRWVDKSKQTVSRRLPATLDFDDIVGLRLETTFARGEGGDKWNLDHLKVRVRLDGETRTVFDRGGNPLVRFTGDVRASEFRWPSGTTALDLYWSSTRGDNFSTATEQGRNAAREARYTFARTEAFVLSTSRSGSVPLELFWSASRGDNLLTATDRVKREALDAGYQRVRQEGHIFLSPRPGTVPLKLYWSHSRGDHFTTATEAGSRSAEAAGYRLLHTEGHVFPAA
jgi:hypothetical protein